MESRWFHPSIPAPNLTTPTGKVFHFFLSQSFRRTALRQFIARDGRVWLPSVRKGPREGGCQKLADVIANCFDRPRKKEIASRGKNCSPEHRIESARTELPMHDPEHPNKLPF